MIGFGLKFLISKANFPLSSFWFPLGNKPQLLKFFLQLNNVFPTTTLVGHYLNVLSSVRPLVFKTMARIISLYSMMLIIMR